MTAVSRVVIFPVLAFINNLKMGTKPSTGKANYLFDFSVSLHFIGFQSLMLIYFSLNCGDTRKESESLSPSASLHTSLRVPGACP